MKRVIKELVPIVLVLVCVVFFIQTVMSKNEEGKYKVYDDMPGILEQMNKQDPVIHTAGTGIDTGSAGSGLLISYTQGAQKKGTSIVFKDMLEVTINGQVRPGSSESGFAIYLKDITDTSGNSRMVSLSSDAAEESDEIYADFVYDSGQDVLYIHGSGVYYVHMMVYTDNGESAAYEFALPVE